MVHSKVSITTGGYARMGVEDEVFDRVLREGIALEVEMLWMMDLLVKDMSSFLILYTSAEGAQALPSSWIAQ